MMKLNARLLRENFKKKRMPRRQLSKRRKMNLLKLNVNARLPLMLNVKLRKKPLGNRKRQLKKLNVSENRRNWMLLKPHSWQNKLKSLPLRKNNAKHLRKLNTRDVELKKRSAKRRKKRLWLQLQTMLSARRLLKSKIENAKLTKRRLMNSLERLLRRLQGSRLSRMQS